MASAAASRLVELQERAAVEQRLGWRLEEQADAVAHELIVEEIRRLRPDDGLLSEEGFDDGTRTEKRRTWIVDPLDGSSPFGQGSPEWAVHVALAIDGEPAIGAVAVPGLDMLGTTQNPPDRAEDHSDGNLVVVTGWSRSRTDGVRVAPQLNARLFACSSAGFKVMLVATGRADVYVHGSPLYEWDVCAPAAVALAAGLHVSDASGEVLRFNQGHPVVPSLVVCRPELAERVLLTM